MRSTIDWDQFESFAAYDAFTRAWLLAARRVLKPNGTIWVIGSYHNIFRVGATMQDLGYWILNDVVWRKTNPMPNFRGRRFQNAHETLIWASRDQKAKGYTFNYDAMKAANDDVQMRSDWLFPICTGAERLKDEQGRQAASDPEAGGAAGPHHAGLDQARRRGARPVLRLRHDRRGGQAARPPLRRHRARAGLYRCRARAHRRGHAAGGRRPADDVRQARRAARRLRQPDRCRPHEAGHVPLRCQSKRWAAKVRADGTLAAGDRAGSIHRIGAEVQGLDACNGWTFWHYERNGGLTPIDELRRIARLGMERAGA